MNTDKTKILSIAVILLLILNFGILAFLWLGRPHTPQGIPGNPPGKQDMNDRMPPPGRMEGGPKEFLTHELSFTDKQKQDYEKLIDEHQNDIKKIREQTKKDKDDFWDNLSKKDPDVNSSASKLAEDQKQLELATFKHFQKVRELCTDEQKKKFDKVINEALRMMAPQGPPPPRPGRGPKGEMPEPPVKDSLRK